MAKNINTFLGFDLSTQQVRGLHLSFLLLLLSLYILSFSSFFHAHLYLHLYLHLNSTLLTQLKAIAINDQLKIVHQTLVNYDTDLPEFR